MTTPQLPPPPPQSPPPTPPQGVAPDPSASMSGATARLGTICRFCSGTSSRYRPEVHACRPRRPSTSRSSAATTSRPSRSTSRSPAPALAGFCSVSPYVSGPASARARAPSGAMSSWTELSGLTSELTPQFSPPPTPTVTASIHDMKELNPLRRQLTKAGWDVIRYREFLPLRTASTSSSMSERGTVRGGGSVLGLQGPNLVVRALFENFEKLSKLARLLTLRLGLRGREPSRCRVYADTRFSSVLRLSDIDMDYTERAVPGSVTR